MKLFRDAKGREWPISVNVTSVKRVKSLMDVNLLEVIGGDLSNRLMSDPILLGDVLYALCKPDVDAKGVTDADFGEGLWGDVIDSASAALWDELINFFQNARDRAALRRTIELAQAVRERTRALVEARLNSGVIEKAVEAALQNASDSFGDALASLESTPAPGHSEN